MSDPHAEPLEDSVLEDALEVLDGGTALDLGDREVLEVLGLLAQALDPVAPPPGALERLRSRLVEADGPAPVPLRRAALVVADPWRWLAAAAALFAVGAGALATSIWRANERLDVRLAHSEALVERLHQALEVADVELGTARSRLGVVTAVETSLCALRPPPQSPVGEARGVLWVASDHQHWFLVVDGLAPVEGHTFEVWFLVGDQKTPVSGGRFAVQVGQPVDLGSPEMPTDTRAVAVTLEPEDGLAAPEGPMVLFGDEMVGMV